MRFSIRSILCTVACSLAVIPAYAADIVDTAVGAGNFNTLVAAVKAAGLVDTLKGDGPFTVFAPTDEAFAKLDPATIESLLKPENKGQLAGILTYHVVAGKVTSKQVVSLKGAKTVNGQRVDVEVKDGGVMIDGAKVVTTDIECDNGIIHVIDSVILPASKNIPETAVAAKFNTLVAAVKAGGLAEVLSGDGPFTVFAPTDEAFAKIDADVLADLLKPENKAKLVEILKYHVVAGRVYSEDAVAAKSANTLQGSPITVSVTDRGAMINTSKLLKTDIDASNGVIHVIDTVLMPPAKTSANVRGILEATVAKGAQLYNSGHHGACANLYHQTMTDLMSEELSPGIIQHMSGVLHSASQHHSDTSRAWVLRRGIDQMYGQLSR